MTTENLRRTDTMGRRIVLTTLLLTVATSAQAQLDGARAYWPLPINTNIVSGIHLNGTANASLSVPNRVQGSLDIDSDVYLLSYLRSQAVFGRTAHWQAMLPAGSQSTQLELPLAGQNSNADGLGDLTLGGTINLFGAPELPVREALRHEMDLSVNFGVMATLPTGSYDSQQTLNMGSNRWSTRISLPIVKAFSDWVPTRRTTLEVMPSVVFFGDNDDSFGNSISQDPLYSLEVHLTRDMTSKAFISFDYTWADGGEQESINNMTGASAGVTQGLNAKFLGATLGFQINDNLSLRVSHMQTIDESPDPFELRGSITKVMLIWGWHDVLEPRRRFNGQ